MLDKVLGSSFKIKEDYSNLISKIPECGRETFFAFSKKLLDEIFLKKDTLCCLFYDNDIAVAGGVLWHPEDSDSLELKREHEGSGIDLEVGTYLQLDNTIVLPEYRGRKLQQRVVSSLIKDKTLPVVATASPKNIISCNNLLFCGMKKERLVLRHENIERFVFLY